MIAFLDRHDAPPILPAPVSNDVAWPEEFAVLPIAADGDVVIESLRGNPSHALLIGDPHEAGPLALASVDDVRIEEAAVVPAWPNGEPRVTLAPGDAPLLYALETSP